mmetsp:Transcript_14009/g.21116  ORF Transcript_14009/g.21116 Transcript_14009/m.21116 type:complete len:123 (+) Transcript_14009:43-411(+)
MKFCAYRIYTWLQVLCFLLACVQSDADRAAPIVNAQTAPKAVSEEPQMVYFHVSRSWMITVCFVVAVVLIFNVSMVCYLHCAPSAGMGKAFFFPQRKWKYSNVANVDSEEMSNSEMEQIDIE